MVKGPNGSGKSTLLKLLAGLIGPSEGRVRRPEGDLRTSLGYSGLDLALYPNLTGREHLEFAASMRGKGLPEDELLSRVGLSEASDRAAGQYSTGMRARLKLALAIQCDPAVLLLDEPTASLDDRGRELVYGLVADYRNRAAVVVATNDPADSALATHELVLNA